MTIRGRPTTVSSDHFQQTVLDELGRRAHRAREREGGHAYHAQQHSETLGLLSAYISTLASNEARIAALKNLQDQLNPGPEGWVPSESQGLVLDVAGSDYRQAPPSEILLGELVLAGIEDLAEARGQLTRDLTQRLHRAEREAAKVEPLQEQVETAEGSALEARAEAERLAAELALANGELDFQRNLRTHSAPAEKEADEEPEDAKATRPTRGIKAGAGGSNG